MAEDKNKGVVGGSTEQAKLDYAAYLEWKEKQESIHLRKLSELRKKSGLESIEIEKAEELKRITDAINGENALLVEKNKNIARLREERKKFYSEGNLESAKSVEIQIRNELRERDKLYRRRIQLNSEIEAAEQKFAAKKNVALKTQLQYEQNIFSTRVSNHGILERDTDCAEREEELRERLTEIEADRASKVEQLNALRETSAQLTEEERRATAEGNEVLAEQIRAKRESTDASVIAAEQAIASADEMNKSVTDELNAQLKEVLNFREENNKALRSMADLGSKEAAERLRKQSEDTLKSYKEQIEKIEDRRAQKFEAGEDTEEEDKAISELIKAMHDLSKDMRKDARQQKRDESSDKIESGELLQNYLDGVNDSLIANKEADNLKAQQLKAFFTDAEARDLMMQKALADFAKKIDESVDSFYQYQASIEARVQGSDTSFNDMTKTVRRMVSFSPFFKQSDVIDKIKEAVDAGIAYNVELRAFMQVAKDSIATTFEAFDSNLMRIIRLQQADSTAARLGMEASLTKLFNNYFSDTSYLKDAFDTVSQNLIDATAMLPRDMAAEFEFVVQKWLGAMYSVGVSSSTVGLIAQGLNYLGTGNISALNGNDALQTLMAMSATRAGINYEDMLLNGINAQQTNNLLKSMVEYLQSISENTSNKVTKSAYAEVLGISTTDLVALNNLLGSKELGNTGIMEKLYNEAMTYSSMEKEVDKQLAQQFTRHHFSTWVTNIIENATTAAATGIGSNIVTYGLWKTLGIIEGLTGGIHIPAFSVMGNMVDLSQFTIEGIAKAGIAGLGLMGSLLGGLGSLAAALTGDGWKAWGYADTNKRGSSFGGITGGIQEGFSESQNLNTNMSSDGNEVEKTSMSDKADEGEDTKEVTGKNMEDENKEAEEVPKGVEAIRGHTDKMVTSLTEMMTALADIKLLLAYDRLFVTSDIKELVGNKTATVHLAGNSLTYKLTTSSGDSESAVDITNTLFGGQSNSSSSTSNSLLEAIMNSILLNESLALNSSMMSSTNNSATVGGSTAVSSASMSNTALFIERLSSLTDGDVETAVAHITTLYNSIAKHTADASTSTSVLNAIEGDTQSTTTNGTSSTMKSGNDGVSDEMSQEELINTVVQRILESTINVKVTNQGMSEAISVVEIGGI